MEIDFGKGLTLIEASPYLMDPRERVERILDVVERNSIIEGLPPFTEELRRELTEQLLARSAYDGAPGESPLREDRNP